MLFESCVDVRLNENRADHVHTCLDRVGCLFINLEKIRFSRGGVRNNHSLNSRQDLKLSGLRVFA